MSEAESPYRLGFRIFILSCILAFSGYAHSQEVTATLVGLVTDGHGGVIPGAHISVTDSDKRLLVRSVVSDARGEFVATLLPVGHYSVLVASAGFKSLNQTGIDLHADDRVSLSLVLKPGEAADQVTVNADALQVQSQTAESDELISGTEIRELSINNRNFLGLLNILPGVTNTSSSDSLTIGAVNPTGGVNSLTFSLNGGRVSSNSFLLDGSDNLDRGANTTLINTPSVDAVQEFIVVRGVYSAQFGRNASSQINIITRSGDSVFHGVAYEFFRNNILDANNALNNFQGVARPPYRYNDFGYTLGGPVFIPHHYNVARDKTFFFFSEEFHRIIDYPTESGLAPTAAMKTGVFQHPVCVAYVDANGTICKTTASQITTFDPVAAAYVKDVYNGIPASSASNNYVLVSTSRAVYNLRQEFVRIDHVLNSRNTITGRYILDTANTVEPYGYQVNALIPDVATTQTQSPGANAMLRLTSVIRPSLLNEVAFAFTTGRHFSTPIGLLAKSNATDVNVNLPFQSTLGNVPYVSIEGLSGAKGFGVYDDRSRNYNFFDDATLVAGRHTIKIGATYNYYQKTENNASTNAGSFTFNPTTTPAGGATGAEQGWANFLLGTHASFAQTSLDLTPDIRQNESEYYIQDDFRWLSNLTINAGVRYSLYRLPYDDRDMLSNFDPALYVPANAPTLATNGATFIPGTGNPLNGIIVNNATSPYGSKVSNEYGGRFAPRVGFSWDPFHHGKLALRGGYGIAFDSTLVGIYENNIFTNPPYLNNLSVNNTTFANPSAGIAATSLQALRGTPLPATVPYTQMYSFDVQRALGGSGLLDVGYYGAKATHLIGIVDINTLHPGEAVAAGTMSPNVPLTTSSTAMAVNALRPYRGYTAINNVENWFGSNYSSLQVSAQKRLAGGSILRLAYTWQKTLTDAGTDRNNAPQDGYNLHEEYAVAPFNRSQILVLSYIYRMPFFAASKGFTHATLHGWELSGTTSFDAGLATQITSGSGLDPAGLGVLGSSSTVSLRPDRISNPNVNAPHTLREWFNTAAYAEVPKGQVRVGDAPSTSLVGPGFQQWDISLFRNLLFTDRWSGQIRVESFNAFNHTNPATMFTATEDSTAGQAFGEVSAVREPRRIQLGAKIIF